MKKSLTIFGTSLGIFFITFSFASAQSGGVGMAVEGIVTISSLITLITTTVVKSLGTLALAAGVVAFFYGVVRYVWGVREAKPDVIASGNKFMGYGLLALFVMFSVYGIIKFGQNIFFGGIDVTKITIPEINFGKGGSSNTGGPTTDPLGGSTGGRVTDPLGGSTGGAVNPGTTGGGGTP